MPSSPIPLPSWEGGPDVTAPDAALRSRSGSPPRVGEELGEGSTWIPAPVLVDEPATSAARALSDMSGLNKRDDGDA